MIVNTASTHDELTLDQLKVGDAGLVGKIGQLSHALSGMATEFNQKLVQRLMEIGFIPGETLQVLHKGFWGGEPIAVRVGQSTFALRRAEAELISVVAHNNSFASTTQ